MGQGLGVAADPVWIEFFVAVSRVIGKRKVFVEKGGLVTDPISVIATLLRSFRPDFRRHGIFCFHRR